MSEADVRAAALRYHARGWSVIPIEPHGKRILRRIALDLAGRDEVGVTGADRHCHARNADWTEGRNAIAAFPLPYQGERQRMSRRKPAPNLIRGGHRFADQDRRHMCAG